MTEFIANMDNSFALAAIFIICAFVYLITKKIITTIVKKVVESNRVKWDDYMYQRGVFNRLALLAPGLIVHVASSLLDTVLATLLQKIGVVYITVVCITILDALLNSVNDIYSTYESSKNRPIKGYLQVVKIFTYIVGGIVIISVLTGKSPVLLLSGLGALSAVIMLIFKDSILGLVAGVQLSANDMVRIGDWIEMTDFSADGDVIDISLNTVKIRNFDKTITTIPTYALVSNSFKNWRGMSESGGRRIKRSILIDVSSVHFVTEEQLDALEAVQILKDYIQTKRHEIKVYNESLGASSEFKANGRHQTNLGLFRWYLIHYLKHHPDIHEHMTQMVRQKEQQTGGMPLEIYAFANTTDWAIYESIQSDIFDHIFAVLPYFELRAYQQPSGADIRDIKKVTMSDVK